MYFYSYSYFPMYFWNINYADCPKYPRIWKSHWRGLDNIWWIKRMDLYITFYSLILKNYQIINKSLMMSINQKTCLLEIFCLDTNLNYPFWLFFLQVFQPCFSFFTDLSVWIDYNGWSSTETLSPPCTLRWSCHCAPCMGSPFTETPGCAPATSCPSGSGCSPGTCPCLSHLVRSLLSTFRMTNAFEHLQNLISIFKFQ